jgi:hypothetical protein
MVGKREKQMSIVKGLFSWLDSFDSQVLVTRLLDIRGIAQTPISEFIKSNQGGKSDTSIRLPAEEAESSTGADSLCTTTTARRGVVLDSLYREAARAMAMAIDEEMMSAFSVNAPTENDIACAVNQMHVAPPTDRMEEQEEQVKPEKAKMQSIANEEKPKRVVRINRQHNSIQKQLDDARDAGYSAGLIDGLSRGRDLVTRDRDSQQFYTIKFVVEKILYDRATRLGARIVRHSVGPGQQGHIAEFSVYVSVDEYMLDDRSMHIYQFLVEVVLSSLSEKMGRYMDILHATACLCVWTAINAEYLTKRINGVTSLSLYKDVLKRMGYSDEEISMARDAEVGTLSLSPEAARYKFS